MTKVTYELENVGLEAPDEVIQIMGVIQHAYGSITRTPLMTVHNYHGRDELAKSIVDLLNAWGHPVNNEPG